MKIAFDKYFIEHCLQQIYPKEKKLECKTAVFSIGQSEGKLRILQ